MFKYVCNQCGAEFPKWMGRCTSCNAWNTLEEVILTKDKSGGLSPAEIDKYPYKKLSDLNLEEGEARIKTGFDEFDRVLGGGIVQGSVILISGDPGIGKSTLLLESIMRIAQKGNRVLYVTGEESEKQIGLRASRLKKNMKGTEEAFIVSANDINMIIALAEKLAPHLLVIDSIQTVESTNVSGVSGGVAQVKECATLLCRYAKTNNVAVILIGHVTKEGIIAGPKVLEHIVDTVVYLEGDNFREFRILRSVKNRYGAQGEIGVFEMSDSGLSEVSNPSRLFMNPLTADATGVCLVSVIEGLRPIVLEIQALTSPTYPGTARRVGNGVEYNRLQLLVAVISKVVGYKLQNVDVYVNIVGGMKINDPSLDLGLCASIMSSYTNKVIGQGSVFIGEVGLSGEVRGALNMEKRIDEAVKLGISKIYLSSLYQEKKSHKGVSLFRLNSVRDMLSTF